MMGAKFLLIIGPTAVGKNTVLDRALKDYPHMVDIITYTSRPPRHAESEGNPYHFVSEERFKQLVQQGFFVEWAVVHGRMYGVPRDQIENAIAKDLLVVMDIDVQGAQVMGREYPEAVSIFLLPPSLDVLRHRFVKRGITDEADLQRRLESAQWEIALAHQFSHTIVNDDFEATYEQVRKIIEKLHKNQ
jgi:guanylate kinase